MKTQKEKKRSDVFKKTTTTYDVPSRRVCAIMSFEGFIRNRPVLRSVLIGSILLFFSDWIKAFRLQGGSNGVTGNFLY